MQIHISYGTISFTRQHILTCNLPVCLVMLLTVKKGKTNNNKKKCNNKWYK